MDPILINMAMSQNTFFLTQTYNLRFFTHEIHRVSDYIPNDFVSSNVINIAFIRHLSIYFSLYRHKNYVRIKLIANASSRLCSHFQSPVFMDRCVAYSTWPLSLGE